MSDNITKIKYIRVLDRLFEVENISFFHMTVTAVELSEDSAVDVPENEIFDLTDFADFKITIKTRHSDGPAQIISLAEYKKRLSIATTEEGSGCYRKSKNGRDNYI